MLRPEALEKWACPEAKFLNGCFVAYETLIQHFHSVFSLPHKCFKLPEIFVDTIRFMTGTYIIRVIFNLSYKMIIFFYFSPFDQTGDIGPSVSLNPFQHLQIIMNFECHFILIVFNLFYYISSKGGYPFVPWTVERHRSIPIKRKRS